MKWGKNEIMGFKHPPKRYKLQKRGQKHIMRHHVTQELTRQKLHPETLHLKVVGMALGRKPHTASKTECLAVCTGILDNQICFHFVKGWDIFLAWAWMLPKGKWQAERD